MHASPLQLLISKLRECKIELVGARHASPGIVEQRLHKRDAYTASAVADFQIAEMQESPDNE